MLARTIVKLDILGMQICHELTINQKLYYLIPRTITSPHFCDFTEKILLSPDYLFQIHTLKLNFFTFFTQKT